jgi:hypothetical protein
MLILDYKWDTTGTTTSVTFAIMDVELVYNDNEGEYEGCVHS